MHCTLHTTLYEYDEPLSFTFFAGDRLWVAMLLDHLGEQSLYMVTPTTEQTVAHVLNGHVTMAALHRAPGPYDQMTVTWTSCVDFTVIDWSPLDPKKGREYTPKMGVYLHHEGRQP